LPDHSPSSIFSEQPEETLVQRRGVSLLAVAALVVSCAAAVAMLGPIWWAVPVVGISLAALALARIRAADPRPWGESLAIAALFMSLLFAAAAPSHYFFRQVRVRQQAEEIAEEWFTLLRRQQYATALELSVAPRERQPLNSDLAKLYAEDEQRGQRLEEFVETDSLARELTILLQRGGQPKLLEVDQHFTSRGVDQLGLIYEIRYEEDGKTRTRSVRLSFERENSPHDARGLWKIVGWEPVD